MNWEFFYFNKGGCYRPGHESEVMANAVASVALARAEAWARENGVRWAWDEDEPAECQRDDGSWETLPAVSCVGWIDHCGNHDCDHKLLVGSLGGITESDDSRERDAYRRVVQAELAAEFLAAEAEVRS